MRFTGLLSAIFLFPAFAASAQTAPAPENSFLLAPPAEVFAETTSSAAFSPVLRDALLASARSAAASPSPAPAPQGVQGVFPTLSWQAYVGYSYMRFYELPNTAVNTNGFSVSMAHFFKDWIAGEGDLDGEVGSQGGQSTKSVFAGGGLRLRWAAPRAAEFWVHGVVGGAHFAPKTSFGGEGAFGYEGGGGIDFKAHHQRIAYRIEADLMGTMFFSTYQVSPKISAGIVYKF